MFSVVLCTAPPGEVERIARTLVEEKLVACINIVEANSYFRWEGNLEIEKEALLVMKTRTDRIDVIIKRIQGLHSYEVPEIIALPIISGNEAYLNWITESVE